LVLSIIISLNIFENKVFSLIIGLLFSLVISSITTIFILFQNKNIKLSFKINFSLLKSSILSGIKIQIGLIATIIGTQLGIFILASQIDNESAGIYSVSLGLVNMLLVIPNSIRTVFQSRMREYLNLNKSIEDLTLIIFRQTLIVMMFCCVILIVFGKGLIFFLYGLAYVPSYGPLLILLFYIIFRSVGSSFGTYFSLEKKFWFGSKAVIITVILNILLSILFSKSFGIYGVAMATSISWFFWFIICTKEYLKMTKTKIKYLIPSSKDIKLMASILKNQSKA
jgi:O-antigen/teichoic acid export membrane protein